MCFPFKDWPDPSQLKRLKYQLLFCFSQANVHQHSLRNSLVTYINSYLVALGHTSLKYSKGECFNQYRRSKWAPHSAVLRHQLNSLKQMFSQLVNLVHTRIARTRAKDKEVASQRCLTLTNRWSHQSGVAFCTFFFLYLQTIHKMQDLRTLSYHSDREGGLAFHKHISSDVPLCHCHAKPEVPTGCESDVLSSRKDDALQKVKL